MWSSKSDLFLLCTQSTFLDQFYQYSRIPPSHTQNNPVIPNIAMHRPFLSKRTGFVKTTIHKTIYELASLCLIVKGFRHDECEGKKSIYVHFVFYHLNFIVLFPFLIKYYYILFIVILSLLGCDRLSGLVSFMPLYFLSYSRLDYRLRLSHCLISVLLFPCASVWENTRA